MAKSPTDEGPFPGGGKSGGINFKQPRVMDFRPSQGLASGLKRVGGRNGISRLGRATADAQKHGKIRISHKY